MLWILRQPNLAYYDSPVLLWFCGCQNQGKVIVEGEKDPDLYVP